MLDLHQGFTGDDAAERPPTVSSLMVAQLEVASSLSHGRFKQAALDQLATWRLFARVAVAAVREKINR